ncbi:MAG: hypothetical protein GY852_01740, partial [bacterium]|nr:hypothetical protein [bacterium]
LLLILALILAVGIVKAVASLLRTLGFAAPILRGIAVPSVATGIPTLRDEIVSIFTAPPVAGIVPAPDILSALGSFRTRVKGNQACPHLLQTVFIATVLGTSKSSSDSLKPMRTSAAMEMKRKKKKNNPVSFFITHLPRC